MGVLDIDLPIFSPEHSPFASQSKLKVVLTRLPFVTSVKITRPEQQSVLETGETSGRQACWETPVTSCGQSNRSVAGTQARRQM